jgi:hypothetical protein
LEEASNIIISLQKKFEAEGKPGLSKTVDFYLKELKFDPKNVMEGLDEEITAIKMETEQLNQMHVNKIKDLM